MKCSKGLVEDHGSRWTEGTKHLDRSGTMHVIQTEQNGVFEMKCRRKMRNGGLEIRMRERDQS